MYSNLVDVDERKAVGSFLEDPSKDQRVMSHLDRLQAIQMDVGAQMVSKQHTKISPLKFLV